MLLKKREVNKTGNRPSAFSLLAPGDKTRSMVMQKRKRAIFSQINVTSLGNKGFIQ